MAIIDQIGSGDYSGAVSSGLEKADEYGSKWLNGKITYGTNYLKNYLRSIDKFGLFGIQESWTILDEAGGKAFDFDVFLTASVKAESKVTTMPVEEGGFVSFNLVETPLEVTCTLAKRGFPEEIGPVVDALRQYASNTKLLSIVTPEGEYKRMHLAKVAFDRSAEVGTDLLVAECSFVEIREVSMEYTSAKVAHKKSRGRQQGKEVSAAAGIKARLKKLF